MRCLVRCRTCFLLSRSREASTEGDKYSTLIFAATDTTSNALSRILQLLAEHPDVQDKMRAEIIEASPDGEDIPYDDLVALSYMDAVCRETLRLFVYLLYLC